MPLNGDDLGNLLFNSANTYNDIDVNDIEQARRDFWKAIGNAIVDYVKANGDLHVPGTGLTAGANPVTGLSTTGKMH